MAEIVLFHHVHGLTPGVVAFADDLRAAGHVVHTPDLYEGRSFEQRADSMKYVQDIGFETVLERGRAAAAELPDGVVYAGMSLGVVPAQALAQTRPGARGALLLHACIPLAEFGGTWPAGVPLQLHTMADDESGDADVAREVAAQVEGAELFLYPGDRHLFTDRNLPDHDAAAARAVIERALELLARLG